MAFYIRKSIRFGLFRFNLSKSGVGMSLGVKGARISTGPRGTYIHMGRHGGYYRQRIDRPMQQPKSSRDEPVEQDRHENMDLQGNPHTVKTADVSELVESSSKEVLSQINTRCRKIALAPFALVGTAFVSLLAISLGGIVSTGILLTGLVSSWILHHRSKLNRTTPLFYELEPDAANRFLAIQKACESLTHADRSGVLRRSSPIGIGSAMQEPHL